MGGGRNSTGRNRALLPIFLPPTFQKKPQKTRNVEKKENGAQRRLDAFLSVFFSFFLFCSARKAARFPQNATSKATSKGTPMEEEEGGGAV